MLVSRQRRRPGTGVQRSTNSLTSSPGVEGLEARYHPDAQDRAACMALTAKEGGDFYSIGQPA